MTILFQLCWTEADFLDGLGFLKKFYKDDHVNSNSPLLLLSLHISIHVQNFIVMFMNDCEMAKGNQISRGYNM